MPKANFRHTDEFRIYLLNGAQILSMTAMSFGIPLVIGIEQYGKYAAIFSLPATLSVFMQGLYISCIGKCKYPEFRAGAIVINLTLSLLALWIGCLVFGAINGVLMSILFAVLVERFRCEALALMRANHLYTDTLRVAELIAMAITIVSLVIAYCFAYRSYLLPIALVCTSLLISIFKLIRISPGLDECGRLSLANAKLVLQSGAKSAFVRLHEELFVTIMPYLLSLILGNREAGVFRLTTSFVKFFFKAFPYRYETVIADYLHRPPETPKITRYFLLVNILAISLAISVGTMHFAFPSLKFLESIDVWILASAGFQAVTSIFSPLLVMYRPRFYGLIIIGFLLTAGFLFCYGYRSFQLSFVVMHFVLCFMILRFLQETRNLRPLLDR